MKARHVWIAAAILAGVSVGAFKFAADGIMWSGYTIAKAVASGSLLTAVMLLVLSIVLGYIAMFGD